MVGEMFLFDKFNRSSLETSLTSKQITSFTKRMIDLLLEFNNNKNLTADYFVDNLKIVESSAKFSKNDNPSRPFIFIDVDFMLDETLIEARISAEFNSACCMIPLTYYKYELAIQKTERSGLFSLLNFYKPNVGTSYFYFWSNQKHVGFDYTITTTDAFKFQHHFASKSRNRFYIKYHFKNHKLVSSEIINDENDDYLTYKNKPLPVEAETLYINFANLAYTRDSEWVNSFVKDKINFKKMECFAALKEIFLSLYKGEERETLINEMKIFEMYYI